MPKPNRRSKTSKGAMSLGDQLLHGKLSESDLDVASSADCASNRSNRSSRADNHCFDDFADDDFGEDLHNDFEAKMLDNLDLIVEKSAQTRCDALAFLKAGLASRQLSYFVNERNVTLMDAVEKSLKKGKSDEQQKAVLLANVVFITLGSCDQTDALFSQLHPLLLSILQDNSVSPAVRSQCAIGLSIGCFIAPNGGEYIDQIMQAFYTLFSGSFLKGNGVVPTLSVQVSNMHSIILQAWTLLLTVISNERVMEIADQNLSKIAQLLESSDLDLRLAAGECIALLNEIAQENNHELDEQQLDDLYGRLLQMTKDCQKFRAKKDLKVQRSTFRDILKSVEEGQAPQSTIKFGREVLKLDNWRRRIQYQMILNVMGCGMNAHLASNELLRDIFELGPVLPEANGERKALRNNWQFENATMLKARTKQISKMRDRKLIANKFS